MSGLKTIATLSIPTAHCCMLVMPEEAHSALLGGRDISPMSAVPATNAGIAVPLPSPVMLSGSVMVEAPQLGFVATKPFQ